MTLDEFEVKHPNLIADTASLSEADRASFLKGHASEIKDALDLYVCGNCGAVGEPWCCFKSPEFRALGVR